MLRRRRRGLLPDAFLVREADAALSTLAMKPAFCQNGHVKTTLDLPDDLVREVKIRAVNENRKLKDTIAALLRLGLSHQTRAQAGRRRVALPLVACAHPARPGEEMTPERVARVLLEDESEASRGPVR